MKQKILAMCLSFVMLVTAAAGAVPAVEVQAAEPPETETIVVKGDEIEASYETSHGTEQWDGKEVKYLQVKPTEFANGEFNVTFGQAGGYQMSFLAAVKSAPGKFHIEMGEKGKVTDDNGFQKFFEEEFFSATDEGADYNAYAEFGDGPFVEIPEAGTYRFKIGSWEAGADFRLAEIRFETYHPVQAYDVAADGKTELAVKDWGNGVPKDTVRNFQLNVAEAGNYTITYVLGNNGQTFGSDGADAFQVSVDPGTEAEATYPAVAITKYWAKLSIKQTVSLPEGEHVLRLRTLADGFTIKGVILNPQTVNTVAGTEGGDIIPASSYSNAEGIHAVEAGGNISYSAKGLKVDYAVQVDKSGIYKVSYEYLSEKDAALITQVDGKDAAESEVSASGANPWYGGDYAETGTEGLSFRLEKGLHTVSVLWGEENINLKTIKLICSTPDPAPVTFEVEGEDVLGEESGSYAVSSGKETDINGNEVGYMQVSATQWANGRWLVTFPYAGTYKMQLVMAVPTLTEQVHLEWAPEGGSHTTLDGDIKVEQTEANEYRTFGGPELVVEEPGVYDLKFGSWVANANWKLDKFIFTCDNPKATQPGDEALILKKGSTLTLKEAQASDKKGSLRTNPASGDYVDYVIEVRESGDYTLTYSVGANDDAVEDAFQVQMAEYKENLGNDDFTKKLTPMQVTHYYSAVLERQAIHLDAGKFVLRAKALNSGFSISQIVISGQVVTEVSDDGEAVTIAAIDFNDADNYHAIQGNNIGYAAQGLGLDYAVQAAKGGIYSIVYNYTSSADSTLTAQRLAGGAAVDLGTSRLVKASGGGNWYDADYIDSEDIPILLAEGMNTLRVRWDAADINVKSFTLKYQGSAVDYVKDLLTNLPSKEELTLEDEAAVSKAKFSYDALTEAEKSEIGAALVTKLDDAVGQIPVLQLAKAIADNKADLEKTFRTYNEADYKADKWAQLIAAKDAGLEAIGNASTIEIANRELRNAKAAMEAVEKKLKSILLTADNTVVLAQSKAYRRNGFLNSQVKAGNYADYFVNVAEAGEYIFTYALYADEDIEEAFAVKYDPSEYPDTMSGEYAKVSVPKVDVEGNLVKEIRGTVTLKAGEQTIRFEALSEKVRLNRIKIQRKKAAQVALPSEGGKIVCPADSFVKADNQYMLENGTVTKTASGTSLDYLMSVEKEITGFVSYTYAYAKGQKPKLVLSRVGTDGTVSVLAETAVDKTEGFEESGQTAVVLPAGDYTLRITMENDGVDLKSFEISDEQKVIPAQSIRLNTYRIQLQPKGRFALTAAVAPENATAKVTWSTKDASVAAVDEYGVVTGGKDGSTVITASVDGKTAQCVVVVGKGQVSQELTPSFIADVDVAVELPTLYAGGDAQKQTSIGVTVPTGASLASVTYKSLSPAVAEVSAAGVITAKKAGTAVITVSITLTNGEKADLQKKIVVKKAYIKPKKSNYTVKKGKSVTLKATAYGSNKKITFTLDKKSRKFAKLTKDGKLTGKAKGTVKVTAKAGKVKKTFKVKVK